MARSHKLSKKETRNGHHYASQVIFYASKYRLMRQANLSKIGKSCSFYNLFLAICQEEPKSMRVLLEKGKESCEAGEKETKEAKKSRKRAMEEYIASSSKRQKRTTAETRHGHSSKTTTNSTSAADVTGREDESEASSSDASDDEHAQQDDDEEPRDDESVSQDEKAETTCDTQIKSETMRLSQKPDEVISMVRHEREVALVRGEPLRVDNDYCRTTLAAKFNEKRILDVDAEFRAVLENCVMKLDPEVVKDVVVEYLENRLETASTINPPVVSSDSSTEEILEVLYVLSRISEDAVIRCASTQIMLYLSVQRQCYGNSQAKQHLSILRALAAKKAGNVSRKESMRIYKSYEKDFYCGKRWSDIVDMFGEDGIVILFVVAGMSTKLPGWKGSALTYVEGVGSWTVTQRWTEYQRECLMYLSTHLYGTRKLVNALGPKALERYCARGYLDQVSIYRVDDTTFEV